MGGTDILGKEGTIMRDHSNHIELSREEAVATMLAHCTFAPGVEEVPLEQAFAMLTVNPARAVKIDADLGSLEEGKKADILVVREVEEGQRSYPVITATLVDGRVVSRMWYPALPSVSARFAVDAATIRETVTDEEVR